MFIYSTDIIDHFRGVRHFAIIEDPVLNNTDKFFSYNLNADDWEKCPSDVGSAVTGLHLPTPSLGWLRSRKRNNSMPGKSG